MGVDFNNTCMNYGRYDNLVTYIAQYYSGKSNIFLPEDKEKTFYPFGYIEAGGNEQIKEKFNFDENTPNIIKKWCNNPYGDLSKEEVIMLFNNLDSIKNKITMFDDCTLSQFISELRYCIEEDEDWYIG